MDLHRSGSVPEWEETPEEEWNFWQEQAARTNGVLTPANVVSVVGAGIVVAGLYEVAQGNPILGVGLVTLGRTCDVVDGFVAAKTKTKSPLGEALDAGLDKAQIAAALGVLWAEDIVPDPVALSFAVINVANAVLTVIAKRRGNKIHPTEEGKLSTLGQWTAIAGLVIAHTLKTHDMELAASIAQYASYDVAFIATGLGLMSTSDYSKNAFHPKKNS